MKYHNKRAHYIPREKNRFSVVTMKFRFDNTFLNRSVLAALRRICATKQQKRASQCCIIHTAVQWDIRIISRHELLTVVDDAAYKYCQICLCFLVFVFVFWPLSLVYLFGLILPFFSFVFRVFFSLFTYINFLPIFFFSLLFFLPCYIFFSCPIGCLFVLAFQRTFFSPFLLFFFPFSSMMTSFY